MDNCKPTAWDIASEAFLKSSAFYDRFEESVNQRLIELAEMEPGHIVVDVATGIGDPALSVAQRVGPAGHVIATDQSTAMLDIARKRAQERGLINIEFRQLDANAYNFPDETIDAVVCRWGLMFLTDLTDALGRMRRSLKRGRALAAATWGEPDKVPIISVRRRVTREFGLPESPNDPFRLSSAAAMKSFALSAEFDAADVTRFTVPYEYASIDAFADAQRTAHESRMTALLARPPAEQEQFWRALAAAAEPYAGHAGVVSMPCEVLLLAARRRT